LDGDFAPWVGALIVDLQQPIVLVVDEGRGEEAVTRLARVGYDHTLGYLDGGMEAWKAAGKEVDHIETVTADELNQKINSGEATHILDVRKPTEFLSQHVENATNFPLDYINNNMKRLSRSETYYLHCLGGYRSLIAASILKSRGLDQIVDVKDGWRAIEQSETPKTGYQCPTTISQDVIEKAIEAVV
jgi:rhodanese-related sulfurtransferase